jgi:hypothetical protein
MKKRVPFTPLLVTLEALDDPGPISTALPS